MAAEIVAAHPDGEIVWVRRDGVTVEQALAEAVANDYDWAADATAVHMRPFVEADCPARTHGSDEDPVEGEEECECWKLGEGWHEECAADEPGAFPVWRIE